MRNSMKYLFLVFGTLFAGIGVMGIFIPGLPTTPFLLLAAGCYLRSSRKLYDRLLSSPVIGKHIRNFREYGGMFLSVKIGAILLMWGMILLSIFLIKNLSFTLIVAAAGLAGTIVMGFVIKTVKK
jgi:uncharacterized protein